MNKKLLLIVFVLMLSLIGNAQQYLLTRPLNGSGGNLIPSTDLVTSWTTITGKPSVVNQVWYGDGLQTSGFTYNNGLVTAERFFGETSQSVFHSVRTGTNGGQYGALITARSPSVNNIEFGHSDPNGFGSTIGTYYGHGYSFIAFHGGAGTNSNTFKTLGRRSSILRDDNNGGWVFENTALTNADNQVADVRVTINNNGNVSARDLIASRGDGTGAVYLNSASNRYLYYDGTNYLLNAAPLNMTNNKIINGVAGTLSTDYIIKSQLDALGGVYQPLENQRLSTSNAPTFPYVNTTVGFISSTDAVNGFQIRSISGTGGLSISNYANSLEWMRVTPIGNLSIGSTADFGAKLNIEKLSAYNNESSAGIYVRSGAGASNVGLLLGTDKTSNIAYIQSVEPSTSYGSKKLVINPNGGNIGFGSPLADANFHFIGSELRAGGVANGFISIYNQSSRGGYIQSNSGVDFRIATDGTIPMTFYANGTEEMRLTSTVLTTQALSKQNTYSVNSATYRDLMFYDNNASSVTGAFVIETPMSTTGVDNMVSIKILGYNYSGNGSWSVTLGGYTYNTTIPTWLNHSAQIEGSPPFSTIRLGRNPNTNKYIIILGGISDSWSYPKIHISEMISGYNTSNALGAGWSGSFVTDVSSYTGLTSVSVQKIFKNYGVGNYLNTPAYALGVSSSGNVIEFPAISTSNITGTVNYLSKFNGINSIVNSQVFDNGTGVGIGTNSPTQRLHVAGNIQLDNFILGFAGRGIFGSDASGAYFGSLGGNTSTIPTYIAAENADIIFSNNNGTPRLTIKASTGNIGVGTTLPNQKLELANNGAVGIRLNNTAANTWDIINTAPNGTLDFIRGGVNHLSISSGGIATFSNNIISGGTGTFAGTVTVANAASSGHAVNLGQLTWSNIASKPNVLIATSGDGTNNSNTYINARVIQNSNSTSLNDGLYLGYGNSNSGITRIYGGGAVSGGLEVQGSGDNQVKINGNTVFHVGNYTSTLDSRYAQLSGAAFTGAVNVEFFGHPRSARIGYSGSNYGGIAYGINYTGTTNIHTYAVNDNVTRVELVNGINIFAAAGNTVGTNVSWSNVAAFQRGGSNLYTELSMNNNRLSNLGTATTGSDAVRLDQVQNASIFNTGTLNDNRLSSNVPLENGNNIFLGQNQFLNAEGIIGGFGAVTTTGTTDWNHSTNARSGSGYSLMTGSSTNGSGLGSGYYHPFSFEYATKNGTGNMTQLAIPYSVDNADGTIFFRGRYNGIWTAWQKVITQAFGDERYARVAVNNNFLTSQTITGTLATNLATPEGGNLAILNTSKTGAIASDWRIYNMTSTYGNGLVFWSYNQSGAGSQGRTLNINDDGTLDAVRGTISANDATSARHLMNRQSADSRYFQGVSASVNYVPKVTSTGVLGNSQIFENGNGTGFNTTNIKASINVKGVAGNAMTSGSTLLATAMFETTTNSILAVGGQSASPFGNWLQSTDKTDLSLNYPLQLQPKGGNVVINGYSDNGARLQVNGDTYHSGKVSVGGSINTSFNLTVTGTSLLSGNTTVDGTVFANNLSLSAASGSTTNTLLWTTSNNANFQTMNVTDLPISSYQAISVAVFTTDIGGGVTRHTLSLDCNNQYLKVFKVNLTNVSDADGVQVTFSNMKSGGLYTIVYYNSPNLPLWYDSSAKQEDGSTNFSSGISFGGSAKHTFISSGSFAIKAF